MARDVTFKHSSAGYLDLMASAAVQDALRDEAEALEQLVRPRFEHHLPGQVVSTEVDVTASGDRARATVLILHPAALRIEAKYGYIAQAIGDK